MGKAGLLAEEANEKGLARAERDLQSEIVQDLQRLGIAVLWFRTDKRTRATVGWPDISFCKDGVPWGIEVKADKGRVRTTQYDTMRTMTCNGWQCAVVRSFKEYKNLVFAGYE